MFIAYFDNTGQSENRNYIIPHLQVNLKEIKVFNYSKLLTEKSGFKAFSFSFVSLIGLGYVQLYDPNSISTDSALASTCPHIP